MPKQRSVQAAPVNAVQHPLALPTRWLMGSREQLLALMSGCTDTQIEYALHVHQTYPYLPNGEPVDGAIMLPPNSPRQKNSGGATELRDKTSTSVKAPEVSLGYVDLTIDPIPPRYWVVPDRIPGHNVALITGDGAVGKSILLLQLSAAIVLGKDWLGTLPEPGPVIYLSCEDDDAEICRRLDAIARHYGASRDELQRDGLRVVSLAGKDAVLAVAERDGRMKPTPILDELRKQINTVKPRLVVIDTVADCFAGNENDRSQVRQFITLMRGLAIETDGAVILASHPSLTGKSSDSGLSGSTAWHNSVRARLYLKTAPGDDHDLRLLEMRKSNYGKITENVVLRWRNGLYLPEARAGSFEQMAADARVDNLFLDLLRRFTKQGRNVSDRKGPSYAPAMFEGEFEAKADKVGRKQFGDAMTRLFKAGKIIVITEGPPSHPRTRMTEVDRDASN